MRETVSQAATDPARQDTGPDHQTPISEPASPAASAPAQQDVPADQPPPISEPAAMPATGRRRNGTFCPGHKFSKGNPQAAKVQRLRSGLLRAVSAADVRHVVKRLVDVAEKGEVPAAKLLFDRVLGPILALDIEARLEALEESRDREDARRRQGACEA